jgi:hypothetical protein
MGWRTARGSLAPQDGERLHPDPPRRGRGRRRLRRAPRGSGAYCELAEVAATLDDAFADYPIDLDFTADSLRAMFAAEDVRPGACRLARGPDGRLLGAGLAALRGDRGRIAAMGVRREADRRVGLGSGAGGRR